jgi:hypothetical protein
MTYARSLRSGSATDVEEIKETGGETSIRGFIRLLPLVRRYVSRFSNATSAARGMHKHLGHGNYHNCGIPGARLLLGFMDCQSRAYPPLS